MFDYLAVNGKFPVCIPIIVRFDRNLIFEGKFLLDEKVADVLFDGVGDLIFKETDGFVAFLRQMIQCSVVRCFLTDQAGLRKLGERLLESEVGRISLSENKIGNLCVGKRKIPLY